MFANTAQRHTVSRREEGGGGTSSQRLRRLQAQRPSVPGRKRPRPARPRTSRAGPSRASSPPVRCDLFFVFSSQLRATWSPGASTEAQRGGASSGAGVTAGGGSPSRPLAAVTVVLFAAASADHETELLEFETPWKWTNAPATTKMWNS